MPLEPLLQRLKARSEVQSSPDGTIHRVRVPLVKGEDGRWSVTLTVVASTTSVSLSG